MLKTSVFMRFAAVILAAWTASPVSAQPAAAPAPIAPLLDGLGTHEWVVTTTEPRAQQFFNQGLRLLYAFNHPESLRAFREAARLDPHLAMAYWGQAMALGPNLNAPLTAANAREATAAIRAAKKALDGATPRERMLVDALAARFAVTGVGDRPALDRAYATAMTRVAASHPADADVQTFYADAVMNTMPWDYWQKDGSPKAETVTVLKTLESVIAGNAKHPGAHHYYIHLVEASNDPDRALASADVLGALMPSAGHMVHMPAHIYLRVGRYADAAEANIRAIAADEDYLAQCQAQGLYPVSYYPHNLHFLWAAATLEGRKTVAVDAARQVAEKVPHHHAGKLAWTADFPVTPWLAYARFGMWTEVLTAPRPPATEPYATGIWHYARGLAFVARGQVDRAAAEVKALDKVMAHVAFKTTLKDLPLLTNLQIASRSVTGELAARRGDVDAAVRILEEAVTIEDAIPYNEPPVWHHPVRQILGGVLLDAGRAKEAEAVYRADLMKVRENGWSLFGLTRSLEVQGRTAEAAETRRRFETAWNRADITLTSSRITANDRPAAVKISDSRVKLPSGLTLSYVEHGDPAGVPVILLHGITDSWRSFEHVLPLLPRSFRAFAISQRGHGDSDKPASGYHPREFAGDVAQFMDALDLRRAIVVGHSMGAGNALRFAADFPERTMGVVLMGALGQPLANPELPELQRVFGKLTDPIDRGFARAFQESTIARPIPASQLEVFVDESLKVPARVWTLALDDIMATDVPRTARQVKAPVLILWGTRDAVALRGDTDALMAAMPRARLVVYKDVGHALHWELPSRVAADLAAWIADSVMRPTDLR